MRDSHFGSFALLRLSLLVLIFCYFTKLTSSTVLLKPFLFSFPDLPAKSAVGVNKTGFCGELHVADPVDACSSLRNDKLSELDEEAEEKAGVRFALVERGGCSFEDKTWNIQNARFDAAIVFDDRDKRNLVCMMMNPEGIKVHAVFVSKVAGEILKEHARGEGGECCIYPSHSDASWTVLAISFLSLLLILAFLMIAFTFPRHLLYWQRTNFHCKSLDVRMLEGFPRFTFHPAHLSRSHNGETCAICLEDYKDGEMLKVLPCQHEFHSSCVDSWLTKWGTFCPVCKFDMKTKCIFSKELCFKQHRVGSGVTWLFISHKGIKKPFGVNIQERNGNLFSFLRGSRGESGFRISKRDSPRFREVASRKSVRKEELCKL